MRRTRPAGASRGCRAPCPRPTASSSPCGCLHHHRHHVCVSKEQRHVAGQSRRLRITAVCSHRACDSVKPSRTRQNSRARDGLRAAWYLKVSARVRRRGGTSVDAAWVPPSAYESAAWLRRVGCSQERPSEAPSFSVTPRARARRALPVTRDGRTKTVTAENKTPQVCGVQGAVAVRQGVSCAQAPYSSGRGC
jgi:hypothetical protein